MVYCDITILRRQSFGYRTGLASYNKGIDNMRVHSAPGYYEDA